MGRQGKQATGRSGKLTEPKTTFNKAGNELFGTRWPEVVNALAQPSVHAALVNRFAAAPVPDHLDAGAVAYSDGPIVLLKSDAQAHRPSPQTHGPTLLKDIYWSDAGSALPVSALQVLPGQHVLDMCAAPGGKSILLAHALFLGEPVANPEQPADAAQPSSPSSAALTTPAAPAEAAAAAAAAEKPQTCSVPTTAADAVDGSDAAAASAAADLGNLLHISGGGRPGNGDDVRASTAAPRALGRPLWRDGPRPDASEGTGGWADDPKAETESEGGSVSGSEGGSGAAAALAASQAPHFCSRLVSNEMDSQRRVTLKRVVAEYLPDWVQEKHQVTHYDAGVWYRQKQHDTFDRILIDAPSTVDRLTVQNAASRQQPISSSDWSVKRCLDNSVVQVKLLLAGWCALKPQGRMVYCTGSMFSYENEGSVQKALDKAPGLKVITHTPEMSWLTDSMVALQADKTTLGWCCMPDRTLQGALYLCVLSKDALEADSDSD